MVTVSATLALAVHHHRAGRLQAAEQLYQEILAAEPNLAVAWNLLGVVNLQRSNHEIAADYIRHAIRLDANVADFHCHLGNVYQTQMKLDEAIACYLRALELKPDYAEAHSNLGNVYQTQTKLDDAVACYRQALQLKPDYSEAHNNLGTACKEQGNLDEAAACFRRALELNPDNVEAHYNLGTAFKEQGKLDEAVGCFRRALELKPDYSKAHNNLGTVFKEQGKLDEAVACFRQALELNPDYDAAHNNLGTVFKEQGKLDEAVACFRQALELNPDYDAAHNNLGTVFKEQGKLDEAVACFRQALELKGAISALVHELQHMCLWEGIQDLSQRVIELVDADTDDECSTEISPFSFLTLPTTTTAGQQLRCARRWAERQLKPPSELAQKPSACRTSCPRSKYAIGYLSADFHSHATALLMAELFEKHDRGRFAIYGYSYGPDDRSPLRRRLVNAFDRFIDVRDDSIAETARRIAADEVDILVDLKGYTLDARTQCLALRPAPIQVNYLGYPGTMGASFMDYILVDDFIVPPEQQPFFTEKLVYLPGCYQVNDSQRGISAGTPSRAECGLPEAGFIFCCFNNNYKITAEVFGVWMRLLRTIPGSVLWLMEGNRFAPDNLRREARAQGIAVERLVLRTKLPSEEHLARHRLADLFLDTIPYNAHTTASDALWAGCPVLTIAGETFAFSCGWQLAAHPWIARIGDEESRRV